MDILHLLIRLVIAIGCAAAADVLIPRRIPGGLAGLILIGLTGVWIGEQGFALLRREFGIDFQFLYWQIQGVLIIPAIVGSAIVLYVVTAFIRWARYSS
ncbi:hypothetical protein [Leptolyngbya ohadii]|uniref:hypothetical protein n=1 Tax=Leptolyngbya ohadii TaxID=1962290 RepID=UPI000B59A214|nr:hypothetical protein [Leptolyngbya ohadii]